MPNRLFGVFSQVEQPQPELFGKWRIGNWRLGTCNLELGHRFHEVHEFAQIVEFYNRLHIEPVPD